MSTLSYGTLAGVPDEALLACFLEAFSGYAVPVRLTPEDFRANNALRGYAPELSAGAFEGGRPVGFVLNGRGAWRGLPAGYDLGTGVIPPRRGGGLAGRLAEASLALLRGAGLKLYLLEVLKDNAPALALYKKKGFEVTREFHCYRAGRAGLRPAAAPPGFELRELSPADLPAAAALRGWEPSWQNSDAALRRWPGGLTLLGAFRDGGLAGYGVIKPGGDIPQLAVRPDFRRRGLGAALVAALAASLPQERRHVTFINVDGADAASRAALPALGFAPFAEQYEMLLPL